MNKLMERQMYFSYSQFMVYDGETKQPGCAWLDAHFNQGFARRETVANFRTLLEYGDARLRIWDGPFAGGEYDWVILVPLFLPSGVLRVEGPEEPSSATPSINVASGYYELWCGQKSLDEDKQDIDLFLRACPAPLVSSRIVINDGSLDDKTPFLEEAGVA